MSDPIVSATHPVTLVGGAESDPATLKEALTLAPGLVAADGGADSLLRAGLTPQAVIGDMDSIGTAARAAFSGVLHPIREQESTDFDKALRHIAAPAVIALGFAGGRFDHELAVMNTLVRHPGRACIVVGAQTIVFHCPPRLDLPLPTGVDVSLFPMAPLRCDSDGLVWPTDGLEFAPDGRIGTSNHSAGPVSLRPDGPGLLVILPRIWLALALSSLSGPEDGAPGTGPVRAG